MSDSQGKQVQVQQPAVDLPNRWEVELEYLESEEFLNFLEYLEYWREPKYAKYIVYPNCLFVLSLLKEPRFRKDIAREDVSTMFMDDFYMRWLKKTTNPEGDIEKMAKETNPPADSTTIKTEPGK
ncbi:uncharacterized protein SAPINGB_P002968 [Magnusiomyces paraingens]|uniref:Mediator of RNA polymerase II transcription subunit 31 n=1 Tax=Magnusiomyces paraingens TaxID=2606893 RepID=A0A5E8BQQ5_9ASCO|nr:uncharacterized protein SAPINGB_P002968 [Saprochaete ingens]VVT51053.1 unnamed protein product [Saprochaete ingens]